MKKYTVLLTITAISFFITVGVTSANYKGYGTFSGVYEMSSTGSCLHSINGWEGEGPPYIPVFGSEVWAATTVAHGTWKFKKDGTGTAKGLNYVIDLPPGIAPPGPPWIGSHGPMARGNTFELSFKYYVTPKGVITVVVNDFEMEGRVSIDKQTITLPSAYQEYNLVDYKLGYAVCNTARILIRVKRIPD